MSTGLIALLDDVAGLAKIAAASLDDAAAQATKAGAKAAGIVIDDAAVTPRYVVGFAADRELPIIWRIAKGSLKNKLLFLMPAALALSLFAPWAITPLLMIGGAYLCYEGAEKVIEALFHKEQHVTKADEVRDALVDALAFENEKVAGAVRTDFILSAEIMAVTLATVADQPFWNRALVLAIVGLGLTVLVYGAVALIVKADDAGVSLAQNPRPASTLLGLRSATSDGLPSGADRALAPVTRALGRGLVAGMPVFLKGLSLLGTAAMLWVGGGIVLHGLAGYGLAGPEHAIEHLAQGVGSTVPAVGGALSWLVTAAASGLLGLLLGALIVVVAHRMVMPMLGRPVH